jgi:acetyltransferase-like isoleucine patch superfamily enzyme
MKIGKNCIINVKKFDSEPYLIEIGNHVAITTGTSFVTHDGSAWIVRSKIPDIDVFGEIKIGDNTFIGANCLILPGTRIGCNCVIGAGSVVRGTIPDNSVAMGNPAKIIFKTAMLETLLVKNKHALMTKKLGFREKREVLLKHFSEKT